MDNTVGQKDVFVIFRRDGKVLTGHAVTNQTPNKEFLEDLFKKDTTDHITDADVDAGSALPSLTRSFRNLEKQFARSISMYRDSVISTIKISPMVTSMMISSQLGRYAERRGEKIEHLSSDGLEVYKLPPHSFSSVMRKNEEAEAAVSGAKHLPQIATIGIVSAYDAFLSDLLRVIFDVKPELIFTSEREIKFSELITFGSIDAAKESVISDEIEGVLRKSHHEQFTWMEKKFSVPLREGLAVWPEFIELCERRNLITHTGGIVSEQYLKNCKEHGFKTTARAGDRLSVDISYLARSVEIVAELGFKLIHTMWRKFLEKEREVADGALTDCGMNLIKIRQYKTAERIMEFGVNQKKHHSDRVRRMMVVNLANAVKLGGRLEDAKAILGKNDWSATSPQFQICVAAVNDDHDRVCELLRLGPETIDITATDFRDWPVFRSTRKIEKVLEVFREVFGEPLILTRKLEVEPDDPQAISDDLESSDQIGLDAPPKQIH